MGSVMSELKTDLEKKLWIALKRITAYDAPRKMRRHSERDWGLPFDEAIEYAYENIQQEARNAIRNVRMQRAAPSESDGSEGK